MYLLDVIYAMHRVKLFTYFIATLSSQTVDEI